MRVFLAFVFLFLEVNVMASPPCELKSKPLSNVEIARQFCFYRMKANGCYDAAEKDPNLKAQLRDCNKEPLFSEYTVHGIGVGVWEQIKSLAHMPGNFLRALPDIPGKVHKAAFDNSEREKTITACFNDMTCRIAIQQAARGTAVESLSDVDPKRLTRSEVAALYAGSEASFRRHMVEVNQRGQRETLELARKGVDPNSEDMIWRLMEVDPEVAVYRMMTDEQDAQIREKVKKLEHNLVCVNGELTGQLIGYYLLGPAGEAGVAVKAIRLFPKAAAFVRAERFVAGSSKVEGVAAGTDVAVAQVERRGALRLALDEKPITKKTIIIDSQTAIFLRKSGEAVGDRENIVRKFVGSLIKGGSTDLRITPSEVPELSHIRAGEKPSIQFARTAVDPQAADERYKIVKILEQSAVGRTKGVQDREIVADAFTATSDGTIPTLVSNDKGIYNPMLRMIGVDPMRLGKPIWEAYPEGFTVTIGNRSLRILPVPKNVN